VRLDGRRTSERPGAGSTRAPRRTPAAAGGGGGIARGVRGERDADSRAESGPPFLWDGGERRPACGEGRAAATRGTPVAPRAARPVCRVVAVHLFDLVLVAAWTAAGGHCRPWTRNADRRLGCTVVRRPRGAPPPPAVAPSARGWRRSASPRPQPPPRAAAGATVSHRWGRWHACCGGVATAGGMQTRPSQRRSQQRHPCLDTGGGTRRSVIPRAPRAQDFSGARHPRAHAGDPPRPDLYACAADWGVQAANQRRARACTRASSRRGGALAGPRPAHLARPPACRGVAAPRRCTAAAPTRPSPSRRPPAARAGCRLSPAALVLPLSVFFCVSARSGLLPWAPPAPPRRCSPPRRTPPRRSPPPAAAHHRARRPPAPPPCHCH